MGTTTTNLALYKPAAAETGWHDLVNANFDTLDSTTAVVDNNIFIKGRNAADSANVNMFKVDTSDQLVYGARLTSNGYFDDSNRAVTTSGPFNALSSYAVRLGGGFIGDTTVGYATNVVDSVTAKQATVTGATNASPIVITAAGHGFANGQVVALGNIGGNAAANGKFVVANVTTDTFELAGSTGNGAYTSGGVATTAGSIYGVSVTIGPKVVRVLNGVTGSANYGDDACCMGLYTNGPEQATAGLVIGGATSDDYMMGIDIDASCDYGISFTSLGTQGTGIIFGCGITNYGIDFNSGTGYGAGLMRFKNNIWVVGQNAAASADVNLLKINASDQLELGANVAITDAKNVVIGATTGTKIGTATTQKIGFFNATPIVQPANTTDLRTAMIDLGLLATGGATPLSLNGGTLTAAVAALGTTPAATGALRIPNNSSIYARNAANGADIEIIKVNSSDQIEIGAAAQIRFSSTLIISDTKNLTLSTSTGTQIGTATGQKLAFHAATPVIQHATTGESTGFTAGAGTTVTHLSTFTGNTGSTAYTISDVVKALKAKGLMAA